MNDNPNKTVTMNQTSSNQNAAIEQKKAEIPAPAVHAAEQMARLNLPAAITLNNDKIELKLDSLKFWNINRIDTIDNGKKQNFGIETPNAHYGMVYRELGSPFFIGSGHCESGKSEQVTFLRIFADGKEIKPEKETIHGEKIRVEKISNIGSFSVQYSFELNENRLDEECTIRSRETVKCHCIYFFMHPWSTRFKEMHALEPNGNLTNLKFKTDEGFPTGKDTFYQSITMYDPDSGDALLTDIEHIEGASVAPKRFVWDRQVYRKDYPADYLQMVFPAEHKAVYHAGTLFFPNNGKPIIPQIKQ